MEQNQEQTQTKKNKEYKHRPSMSQDHFKSKSQKYERPKSDLSCPSGKCQSNDFTIFLKGQIEGIERQVFAAAKSKFEELKSLHGIEDAAASFIIDENAGRFTFVYDLSFFRSKYKEISSKEITDEQKSNEGQEG